MDKKGKMFNDIYINDYKIMLNKILSILVRAGLDGQALVIKNLLFLLDEKKYPEYIKLLNSVDMWGGSGAVWEVYIEDQSEDKEFQTEIINLVDLMEKTDILGRGVNPKRQYFKKLLKK